MKFTVKVFLRAGHDVDHIYEWIGKRDLVGAERWYSEYRRALHCLEDDPHRHSLADERHLAKQQVRQLLFATPQGNTYRALYLIVDDEVRILRVRAPGQATVRKRDL
jgi:plasmid stabilization system protein ParE